MIGRLIGQVVDAADGIVTLMVGDVGYEVHTAQQPHVGSSVSLFIHTHVTDESIALFGFESMSRRQRFRTLTKVSGVGPKTALAVCKISDDDFARAVKSSDTRWFKAIKGIGPQSAERIIKAFR